MSIVRLRKVFRKRVKVKIAKKELHLPSWTEIVFGLIILVFLIGAYYTFGGPGGGGGDGDQDAFMRSRGSALVAKVNGFKISRAVFDVNVRMRSEGPMGEMDFTQERWVKTSTLDSLVEAALLQQAAKKEAIRVTGEELNQKKDQMVDDTIARKLPDDRAKRDFVRREHKSIDQYKAELRGEMFKSEEGLREQLAQEKLQKMVEDRVSITDQDLQNSFNEARASHILIMPQKQAEAAEKTAQGKTTEKIDGDALAKQKADKLLEQIKGGADFAKLAKDNSDDPGSAAKGGDLDWFKAGMMVKEFDEAVAKLQPGQVSEVVKSQFGYHIIKLIGRRAKPPKDFAKNKEMHRTQLKDERKYKAWQEYRDELKKAAGIEVLDPELQAYRLLDEGKGQEGKQLLQEAVANDPNAMTAAWELAAVHEKDGDAPAALEILNKLAVNEVAARASMLHLKRGELYEKQKQKPQALEAYKQAFDWATAFTMQNMSVNMQVETKAQALGDAALAKQAKAWLDDFRKQQPAQPGSPFGNFMVQ